MPTKNRAKFYGVGHYYHVYNRGVAKQKIFREEVDYFYFLSLFKKHLQEDEETVDRYGRLAKNYSEEVELNAFCLMPNHFHLLFYLKQDQGIEHIMRSTMTAYTMYFNRKYRRVGSLYQGVFLASRITNDMYFWHISRYIHLNPMDVTDNYAEYPYSSYGYFVGEKHASWLHAERIVATNEDKKQYAEFVADYESMHGDMKLLKEILAAE